MRHSFRIEWADESVSIATLLVMPYVTTNPEPECARAHARICLFARMARKPESAEAQHARGRHRTHVGGTTRGGTARTEAPALGGPIRTTASALSTYAPEPAQDAQSRPGARWRSS
jgi:hypothetical protein